LIKWKIRQKKRIKFDAVNGGESFDFLAQLVSKVHQMSLLNYRERWGIP